MRVTVLGCAGGIPTPSNPNTSLLVRTADVTVAIDFGHGAIGALQRHVAPDALDAVLLTHLHADHCADLASLLVQRRYDPAGADRRRVLPLFAPDGAMERIATAYAPTPEARASEDVSDAFEHHPLCDGEAIRIGSLTIVPFAVEHPVEAYGFRVDDGAGVFAFTGDTGPCPALERLAAGADLLLTEATWQHRPDLPAGNHLSGRQAGGMAARAGAREVLLTHIPLWRDGAAILAEARRACPAPVAVAEPGRTYGVASADARLRSAATTA